MDHVLKYLQGLTDDINKQAHGEIDHLLNQMQRLLPDKGYCRLMLEFLHSDLGAFLAWGRSGLRSTPLGRKRED